MPDEEGAHPPSSFCQTSLPLFLRLDTQMKLTKLMIAAIAVCGVSQTMAAGVTRLTGSSASSINTVRGAVGACTANSGTATVYRVAPASPNTMNTVSLGNQFTVTCSADFAGTAFNELRVNVGGGSESAITNASAYPTSTNTTFLDPASCSGTAVDLGAGTESLAFLSAGAGQFFNCGTTLADSNKSDGGFMDEEGPIFNAAYSATDFLASGFSQVFGIAVNKTLYEDLQAYQKTVAGGSIVPNDSVLCPVGDTKPACQPSLSKAQITSFLNGASNPAKTGGLSFLVAAANQNTAGQVGTLTNKITYCKRPQTSGTQQGAQLYFLNYDALGSLGGKEPVVSDTFGSGATAKFTVSLQSSSGNVKTCVNANAVTDGYKFGVLSLENNPIGGSDSYRFVKLSEVPATEGTSTAAGATNTFSATAGRYDFVYELSAYCPSGTCAPIITAIKANVPAGASSPGIFVTGVESKFGRSGSSTKGYATR